MKKHLLWLFLFLGTGASAGTPSFSTPVITMTRCSESEVKALVFITVAKASLYRQQCDKNPVPLTPPLLLQFHYFHDVPASAFRRSAAYMIHKNLDDADYQALLPRIRKFDAGYRDTHAGDTYRLEYRSDQRLLLFLNGKQIAAEKGREFARAYLDIWFGTHPYSDKMKHSLLTPAGQTGTGKDDGK